MSSSFAGFSIGADPAAGGFKVRDLELPSGVDTARFDKRRKLLDVVNGHFREKEKSDSLDSLDTFYNRAYSLISSKQAREAFDIEKEDPKLRDRYGRNTAGARMLLARRLVESGVRFVTMTYGGWDHHDSIDRNMKRQVPAFDQAYATLISDLESARLTRFHIGCRRFGIWADSQDQSNLRRDHWPKIFSSLMAGGGIKQGQVYGSSNATASEPEEDALGVQDWATTIYKCLGITADKELIGPRCTTH